MRQCIRYFEFKAESKMDNEHTSESQQKQTERAADSLLKKPETETAQANPGDVAKAYEIAFERHAAMVRATALAAGCVAYLKKPFAPHLLLDALKKAVT